MTTGERITRLRESRDVLQKELAKAIDVDPVVLNWMYNVKVDTKKDVY